MYTKPTILDCSFSTGFFFRFSGFDHQ